MIMALIRSALGVVFPAWATYALSGLLILGAIGTIYAKGRSDQAHKDRAAALEHQLARLKADLAANEALARQAQAEAVKAEANEAKLQEIIDALRSEKSCPLNRSHIDGLRRIDKSP